MRDALLYPPRHATPRGATNSFGCCETEKLTITLFSLARGVMATTSTYTDLWLATCDGTQSCKLQGAAWRGKRGVAWRGVVQEARGEAWAAKTLCLNYFRLNY